MNELSLFTGACGGVLGSKILGWRTIGYVEYEPYCQEVIKARIQDGILDTAPIFGDIRKFLYDGYAASYTGMVDIITAGFPCQPFSVAGKRQGENDERNMWPSTIGVIRAVRPKYALLENVPGILADKYMGRIFGDLAESGYSFRWSCLGADDVGANHRRKRLWILAYANTSRFKALRSETLLSKKEAPQYWNAIRIFINERFKDYPGIFRGDDGVAAWDDRFAAVGNGQVPICMAYAFSILSQGIIE